MTTWKPKGRHRRFIGTPKITNSYAIIPVMSNPEDALSTNSFSHMTRDNKWNSKSDTQRREEMH